MIYCQTCSWQPVQEKDLPVKLPFIEDYKPLGTGQAPLASHPEFYKTKCPKCKGDAKRETDVSDTFLDSAWYFLRYVSTDIETMAFDTERVKKWLPVNMYVGGAEHSVLHLLYSRFITMCLHDLGLISFEEPFTKFRAHGLIVKDGAKMSKSKGNIVVPDAYIKKFGADSLRCYLMFTGPFDMGGNFIDSGIEGMSRFLKRVWALVHRKKDSMNNKSGSKKSLLGSNEALVFMNKTIKKVTGDIGNLKYNTAIAGLMEYYNFLSSQKYIAIEEFRVLLKLLAPLAPHIAEELWEYIGEKFSIHQQFLPDFNESILKASYLTIAIQINGKLRGVLTVTSQFSKVKDRVEQLAKESDKIKKYLKAKEIKKIIYIEGKVINFVVT